MNATSTFETHGLTWEDLARLARKQALLVLAVFLCVLVAAWGTLQVFFSDIYESQATLLVKIGRENAEPPVTVQGASVISQGVRVQDIHSEVQLLASRPIIEKVVDSIGPDRFKSVIPEPTSLLGYPKYYAKHVARWGKERYKDFLIAVNLKKRLGPREEAVVGLIEGIKVEPVKESDILVLKVRTRDPALSREIGEAVLREYFERRAEVRGNPASSQFFDAQVAALEKDLRRLRDERARIRDQFTITSPGDERSLLLRQLGEIQSLRTVTDGEISRLAREAESMSGQLGAVPEFVTKEQVTEQNPAIQSLNERITSLRMERAKLLGRYNEGSEVVRKISAEIAELETSLARENATIVTTVTAERNPVVKSLAYDVEQKVAQLKGLRSRAEKLAEPAQRIRGALERLNAGGDRIEDVEREYRLAETAYLTYAKKREEARIAEALDAKRLANVSVVAEPSMPLEPVAPRKLLIMALALPAGLLLGLFAAVVAESMDRSIRNVRDLDQIEGLDVLGTVELDRGGNVLGFRGRRAQGGAA
jgi:uncharacterized protein involved in exopolysaccharide biosynthesis